MSAPAGATTVVPRSDHRAVAAVDGVLAVIATRRLFTADEARRLLGDVACGTAGGPHTEQITVVVSDATEAIGDSLLVDRARLADAMLDVRLALQP